jgi:Tfp pilus assembly protein PilV
MAAPEIATLSLRPDPQQGGFTLIDVVVAVFLLVVSLLPLATVFPWAAYSVHQGMQHAQAAAVAERVFEVMRATPYADINATEFPNQSSVPGYPGVSYSVAFENDTPVTNTRRVTLTVGQAAQGGPLHISFVTIFAQ